jgi:hypothetical protein
MTDTHTEALERIKRYIAEYEDAPNWGGPTMYPAPPKIADLKALVARAALEALPARNDERALKLVEAVKTAIQHAYEEGVEDGSEWATDRIMEPKPQWIDSVARITSLQLERALADTQPSGETHG